ncbi:hypothetical protein GF325_01850, partial [Candidatus Bathyarchaeota archaeon]|nr:hypothetical protein [Candidatus Bathyarchaeota archaeon]
MIPGMNLADFSRDNKSVAIASRLDSGRAINITRDIVNFLTDQGIKVYPEARIANLIGFLGKPLDELDYDQTPAIISVGGDGTILRVAQNLSFKNPPSILGVNVGAVGFLAEFDITTQEEIFSQLMNTELIEERCMRLSTTIDASTRFPLALNEVLIITSRPSKALSIVIKVDGQEFSSG